MAPTPKFEPVRRNPRTGPVILPANGRPDPAPEWPLAEPPDTEEQAAWRDLWRTPHAVMWEQLGWTRTVARYCRVMVAAEQPGAKITLMAEARQLEDRLGLTPRAMRALLWQVAPDEVAEKRDEKQGKSARDRMRAV